MNPARVILSRIIISAMIAFPTVLTGTDLPERIILNLTEDPSSEIAISWRSVQMTGNTMVQYAPATAWNTFLNELDSVPATSERFVTDNGNAVYHHSAIITGLSPEKSYVYRVGSPSGWSEWNQFKTAPDEEKPFTFVWFGDPQNNLLEHCSRVFREAFRNSPEASFWLFSGDLVTEPEDNLYDEYFEAAGFIFKTTPSIMAPGNHDRSYRMENGNFHLDENGKKQRMDEVADIYRKHFTLPENGPEGLEESSFYVDYAGTRFIILNSNHMLEEQAEWLDSILADNQHSWTIMAFHHPFYSGGRGRDDDESRSAFLGIVDRYHVDLILTGHDHTYYRSRKLVNNKVVPWNEPGTVYALSVSGPKQYEPSHPFPELMEKTGGYMQLYQVVSISGNKLIYRAYTVDGELFDEFTLEK